MESAAAWSEGLWVGVLYFISECSSVLFAICAAVALQLDCVGSVNEPCRAHAHCSSFLMAVCSASGLSSLWGEVTKTVSSSERDRVLSTPS